MKFHFDKYSLDLGEVKKYISVSDFEMKNETSYLEKFIKKYTTSPSYRTSLLPFKLKALANIQNGIKGDYESYLELLAGMGMTAKIFGEGLEAENIELSDLSDECYQILKQNFPESVVIREDMHGYHHWTKYDLTFLDFNNCTMRRFLEDYKGVIEPVFANTNKYVVINDCSVFYLKYGAEAYKNYSKLMGVELSGTKDDFYQKSKEFYKKLFPEWSLIEVQAFRDTSFLLFKKGDWSSLSVTVLDKEDIKDYKTELV